MFAWDDTTWSAELEEGGRIQNTEFGIAGCFFLTTENRHWQLSFCPPCSLPDQLSVINRFQTLQF
jgi:hypothetical protein